MDFRDACVNVLLALMVVMMLMLAIVLGIGVAAELGRL